MYIRTAILDQVHEHVGPALLRTPHPQSSDRRTSGRGAERGWREKEIRGAEGKSGVGARPLFCMHGSDLGHGMAARPPTAPAHSDCLAWCGEKNRLRVQLRGDHRRAMEMCNSRSSSSPVVQGEAERHPRSAHAKLGLPPSSSVISV